MITNITEKCIAYLQIVIFKQTNNLAQKYNRIAKIVTPIVCVVDVTAETGKHPAIVIENIAVGIINSSGSAFSKVCSTQDAYKNLQKIKTSSLTAIAMTILLPWNLLGNLRINLPDPKHAHSCNRQAEEQVKEPMIVYNSRNLRPLQEVISTGILSVVENIPIRPILTNSSVDETVLEAISTSARTNIMAALVNDRTTSLSIDMMANSIINRGLIYKANNKNITNNTVARILLNNFIDPVFKEVINKTQHKTKKSIA